MKIYADENIPYVEAFFADFAEVCLFCGRECRPETIADADVLLVRSVTKVNESLLSLARHLKFVGTATIGTDHVDREYLDHIGVPFASCPGSNASSVAQYVLSALKVLQQRLDFTLTDQRVGIIGAGNTGSALAKLLEALSVEYWLCDPHQALVDRKRTYYDYSTLLTECDVLSFHVPLIAEGNYSTYHMLAAPQIAQLKSDAILINACRGAVFDNQALLAAKMAGGRQAIVLDVWENEPAPLLSLLPYVDIATAHIAGYSYEGKVNGVAMLYRAFCQHFDLTAQIDRVPCLSGPPIAGVDLNTDPEVVDLSVIDDLIHLVYDVRRDDQMFRRNIGNHGFDWIRKHYPIRHEFSSLNVISEPTKTAQCLAALDFNLQYK